nr:aminotransferase class I/II-fold pyridoxal phosphate-dependent enzyme [Kibdelosporangium sp. MJ126-NF4]CEL13846.1 O-acetylhomoserine sulfhydrylase / O-succinylhomoserine sulfhydrylase [Kibdelosporangium sp. MJ126-NF4]CTQ88214.1 O-acetylhomoserine sulfhydrylase (EC 2.5.1.49) / O-succinylhomoserine sulfhydrylase (EC 2.5.1.48) [Kibdelosporangium sp. MJ126-NF4]
MDIEYQSNPGDADVMDVSTLLAHADTDPAEPSLAPPIYQTANFAADSAEHFTALHSGKHNRYYRRHGNPSQARLEKVMAAVEGTEAGLTTASGMGAVSTTLLTFAGAGDHVVAQTSMYGGTLSLLQELAPRLGITVTLVEQDDLAAFEQAIRPNTKLVMLETPSNPLLRLTDLAAVADLARANGILTFVDNTVATPLNQRPIDLGVDLVMHSLTKSLSGHADVLAGIVLGSAELIDRIWQTHIMTGAVTGPMDAWLTLRGLRTLEMRVDRHNANALALAQFLAGQPDVVAVNHPGLDSHPQHELAVKQMRGFGGLLSFELAGGAARAEQFIDALTLAARSGSLGGIRSTVVRPVAMWEQELSEEQQAAAGIPAGLVRFAVGLESASDLIADVAAALEKPNGSAAG